MSWHVIMVEGRERELRAFVAGFLADRSADPGSVVFGDDLGIERESVHERLRALLLGGHHALLVREVLAQALGAAIEHGATALGLRVIGEHPVATASFSVTAEAFARDVSTQIRAALRGAPFSQHSEHEEEHAENRGVELYAPRHHYAYRVQATVAGAVDAVLPVRRRLSAIEAARVGPLHIT